MHIASMTKSEGANESSLCGCVWVCEGVWDAYSGRYFELRPPGMLQMQKARWDAPVTGLPKPETACVGQTGHNNRLEKSVFRGAGSPGPACS
jgi:hypothetical protein